MAGVAITTNARGEVVVPFFRAGAPAPDLEALLALFK